MCVALAANHGEPPFLFEMHWDHEPADRAAASWTAPVLWRFRLARLHSQSARRLAHCSKTWRGLRRFMESLLGPAPVQRDREPVRFPLTRPPGNVSPTEGEGWDEGIQFMESPLPLTRMHWDHEPTPSPP